LAFNRPDTEILISTVRVRSGTNDRLIKRSRTGLTNCVVYRDKQVSRIVRQLLEICLDRFYSWVC